MNNIIGIRREDKNIWERRVPLTPPDVGQLFDDYGIKTIIQPSSNRIFDDNEYIKANAIISEDFSKANTILAVKEIPLDMFQKDKTYIFFSHTIKGQPYNMKMLRKLMDLKCNLIDYEPIVDKNKRRLIFFGKYAGLAGMIETLHSFSQKLSTEGKSFGLENVKQAFEYASVEEAKEQITKIGSFIKNNGMPKIDKPIIIGFAGYGNVSQGAQEIFDLLPHQEISPDELSNNYNSLKDTNIFYKVVFKEKDLVQSKHGEFDLQEYYTEPHKYISIFEQYLLNLNVLVNCIYWSEEYPRLVTKDFLQNIPTSALSVVGDISCDIDGSIEFTHKATYPDTPTFTYLPKTDSFVNGANVNGVTVMSVDNLPCEFPRESSRAFSIVLKDFVKDIASTNFNNNFNDLTLPAPIKEALILHKGQLTKKFEYLNEFTGK